MERKCPSDDVLLAFAEGLIGRRERAEVETHLGGCERCREHVEALIGLASVLGSHRRDREGVVERPDRRRGASSEECPDDELLAAYADGSLRGRRTSAIEGHVAGCGRCLSVVADLIVLTGAEARDTPDHSVERVLARLDDERKTAVVRLAERSVELVRDFARVCLPGESAAFGASTPAFATAREGLAPVRVAWSGEGGLQVECEIRRAVPDATLTGRVTAGGEPARATSVTLVTPDETVGPESPDPRGRFGPWPLPAGRSRLVLSGGAEGGRAVELSIEVEADDTRLTGGEDRPGQASGASD